MRILAAALGSPGHTFPLLPLTLALRDAGHTLTFAAGPESVDTVAGAGLDAVRVGRAMGEAFGEVLARQGRTERPTDPEEIGEVAGAAFGDVLPRAFAGDVGALIDERVPDLVIAESGATGAALAAVTAGVPCVIHSFGRRPDPDGPMGRAIRAGLGALAAERGLGPLPAGATMGHAYLDVCPPSLQAPTAATAARELPLRPTPWNPPVPGFARRHRDRPDRPWAYLTLGTAMGDAGVLRTAVTGLTGLGVDVLLATGSVEVGELTDLDGEHVQVEPFVPQADLLTGEHPPALVVHHGGSGTTLAAVAAGVPQLVLPQGADQFGNAAALVGVGVARALVDPDQVTADAVVAAAGDLLGGGYAGAAHALAVETAAMPSPAVVAADVERWARP